MVNAKWFFLSMAMLPGLAYSQDIPYAADAGWNSAKVCEIISEDDQIRVMHCIIAARGGHERHYHLSNIVYVLVGGEMRITQNGEVRDVSLKAGQSFISAERVIHEVVSLSDHDQSYLIIEKKY